MLDSIPSLRLLFVAAIALRGSVSAGAQLPPNGTVAPIAAGPVYTRSQGSSSAALSSLPAYPSFDVVVPLDPAMEPAALSPAGWEETEPGRSSPVAATAVRRFDQTSYGLSLVLALDASGSMRGRSMKTIRGSVTKFIDQAGPRDRVAVMTFADEARWDVPFRPEDSANGTTAQTTDVRRAIGGLAPRGHQTHLYDAMLAAVDRFDDSLPKRRVLIVISDGHDEGSVHSLRDVISEAKARKIAVHAIGVTRSSERYLRSLKSVAGATGGTYAAAPSDEEMDRLLGNGVAALKQTPVVTFTTARNDSPSRTIPISIRWRPGNLTATAELTTMPIPGIYTPERRQGWFAALAALLVAAPIAFVVLRRRKNAPSDMQATIRQPQSEGYKHSKTPGTPSSAPGDESNWQGAPPHDLPGWRVDSVPRSSPLSPVDADRPLRHTRLAVAFPVSPQGEIALLHAVAGPLSGTTVVVDRSPFTIGAAADNHLPIDDDPTLSGHHASLSLESSILFLDDLDSLNGTDINGVKLSAGRRSLSPGDELRLGRSLFRVAHPPGPAQTP